MLPPGYTVVMTADTERARALALLEHNHVFPGAYSLRVVVRPELREKVLAVVGSSASGVQTTSERASRKGTYVSLRLKLEVSSAEVVLDVYDALRELDGVLATL